MDSLIKESTFKYLRISHPQEEGVITLKTDANSKSLTGFLDEFFDLGYVVDKISRDEFNKTDNSELLKFNVKK